MNSVSPIIIAALLFSSCAWAQEVAMSANPYSSIVARNMFGLVPIPVVDPASLAPPADPPPKISPNGIMTLFGKLQALFRVTGKGKPGQPPKEDSYMLAEGERQDDIEVVKIDQENRTITFNNHGTVQELPLVAAANSTVPAAHEGDGRIPRPGFNPGMMPRPGGMTPAARAAFRGNESGENKNFANPNTADNSGGPNLNNGGLNQTLNEANNMTPEQQAFLIETQRKILTDQGSPIAPLFPPTRGDAKKLVEQIGGTPNAP